MVKCVSNAVEVDPSQIDKYDHVNYATYLRWYEIGHRELLKQLGTGFKELRDTYGLKTFVRRADIDYLAEVQKNDTVTVHTGIDRIGNTSMTYDQRITRGDTIASKAKITVVFVNEQGTPETVPQEIRDSLEHLMKE